MRRPIAFALALALACPLAACGSDEGDRGLTPPDEEAAPASEAELEKTEQERQQETP